MTSLNRRQLLAAAGVGAVAVPIAAASSAHAAGRAAASPAAYPARPVTTGAQRAAASGWSQLAGEKVGVITNPTGILTNLRSIVDEMHAAGTVDIAGVFGPEHGFRGTAQAGGSEGTYTDERTGITVYDAYGANADKLESMFRKAGVETVVFDIQDAGARFYTYIWTMYTAMRAAVRTGARFVVLDRPNPIGGTARGPMMTPARTSCASPGAMRRPTYGRSFPWCHFARALICGAHARWPVGYHVHSTHTPRASRDQVCSPRTSSGVCCGVPWRPTRRKREVCVPSGLLDRSHSVVTFQNRHRRGRAGRRHRFGRGWHRTYRRPSGRRSARIESTRL